MSAQQMIYAPVNILFYLGMTSYLCADCISNFSSVQSPICTQCGKMFESRCDEDHLCGDCITGRLFCDRIRAAGIYHGALKSTIHALKYDHKIHLSRPLGRLLFAAFSKYFDSRQVDLILPVPLHVSRLKQRGFNQAALLVHQWPELIKQTRDDDTIEFDDRLLIRKRKTKSQTGLGRQKRKQNVKGAFAVINPAEIVGKRVLLIDDVYTTGSTSDECAKTLIANGAERVSLLTLARAN